MTSLSWPPVREPARAAQVRGIASRAVARGVLMEQIMSVRIKLTSALAFGVVVLSACSDDSPPAPIPCTEPRPGCDSLEACFNGECYEALFACDTATGEWVIDAFCHPNFVWMPPADAGPLTEGEPL